MSAEVRTADGRILTAAEKAAHEAIAARLSWASLHWGTERVSPEAWPHIAIAVTAAVREQVAQEIEVLHVGAESDDDRITLRAAVRVARGGAS